MAGLCDMAWDLYIVQWDAKVCSVVFGLLQGPDPFKQTLRGVLELYPVPHLFLPFLDVPQGHGIHG